MMAVCVAAVAAGLQPSGLKDRTKGRLQWPQLVAQHHSVLQK